ncbi:MAG: class I SAM-dependent methyltransferase [Candidatus Melainabacteria bacterium]|nr:class I SAM-dependent methyltransferase [Candidatus Melainabacteria bacterium]
MTPHEPCSAHGHDHMDKRFNDAEKWALKFDDPKRAEWQKPEETIKALRISDNDQIADIGAGTGYFSIRIAKKHPQAKVLAIDVEPDMVAYIEKLAKKENLSNVQTFLVSPTTVDLKLPVTVDKILVVNTYHHIPDRTKYFKDLSPYLKADGKLVIIDFKLESPEGPPIEYRIEPAQLREELKLAGYEQVESLDFLQYQYFLVFQKLKSAPL